MGIFDLLGKICGYILWFFYDLFDSYGVAIICFTLVLMLILFPFEVKRTRSMAKSLRFSKKTREIQEKYAKNREKMNEELAKLYQEEGSPMKGCLSQMLIPLVFFGVFAAIRQPLSLMFGMSSDKIQSAVDAVNNLPGIGNIDRNFIQLEVIKRFSEIKSQLPMFDAKDIQNITDFNKGINFFGINLLDKAQGSSFNSFLWVFPVIAAITALIPFFFKKFNSATTAPMEGPGSGCNKIMPVVFVGLFVWIVWTNPAALGVYYIVSNIFRLIQSYIINKFYNINIYNAKCEAARIALLEQEEACVEQDFSLKKDFKTDYNNVNNKKKKK